MTRKNRLEWELSKLLNRVSAENDSDTPDFILARYLRGCLINFNGATRARDEWYGRGTVKTVGHIDLDSAIWISPRSPKANLDSLRYEITRACHCGTVWSDVVALAFEVGAIVQCTNGHLYGFDSHVSVDDPTVVRLSDELTQAVHRRHAELVEKTEGILTKR